MPPVTTDSEPLARLRDRRRRADALPGRCEPGDRTTGNCGTGGASEAGGGGSSTPGGGGSGSGPGGRARGPLPSPRRPIPHTVQYRWAGCTAWPLGQSPGSGAPHSVQYRLAVSTSWPLGQMAGMLRPHCVQNRLPGATSCPLAQRPGIRAPHSVQNRLPGRTSWPFRHLAPRPTGPQATQPPAWSDCIGAATSETVRAVRCRQKVVCRPSGIRQNSGVS